MRLHLACGTVYLDGYKNIDIKHKGACLAKNRPDVVEQNITDWEHYYKEDIRRDDFIKGTFHDKKVVCDEFADIRCLPYKDETIDEILAVQVFEHFTYADGKKLLYNWYDILKMGGVLHLDIPDLDGTVELYKSDPVWATRLLYGSQKNEYGVHKAMYTKNSIAELLQEIGFTEIEILPNIHTYPAFGVKGVK